MKSNSVIYMFLYALLLGQRALYADLVDPNLTQFDPNTKTSIFSPSSDPNTTSLAAAKPIAGTLGMNWLYQGKKPPRPLVGQENVTFRIERYPWPYTGYFYEHGYFAGGPWFYAPWYRHDYWRYYSNNYWRHHGCDYWRHDWHNYGGWYNDAYTYPLNYVEMQIKLNENTSFNLGVSYTSDPVPWP